MASQMDLFASPTKPASQPVAPVREPPTDPDAGPRQTCARLRHPTLGEVVAVYEHGPAYLRTADGARVDVRRIEWGGVSSARDGKPARSWHRVRHADGVLVEADVVVIGPSHRRMSSPLLGMGWMVTGSGELGGRWEGDDGRVVKLDAVTWQTGDAAYIAESARVDKSRKRDKAWPKLEGEARHWMRLTMRDGTSMDFRREEA